MMRSTAHRIALLALLLPASLAAAVPVSAAAAKPPGHNFHGSAVIVSASPGCADRRKLTPGDRFDFSLKLTKGKGSYLILIWRTGFRVFAPPGNGVFRKQGAYVALTNYGGKNALFYEGTYEDFTHRPAQIDAETAEIEFSFTTLNQDKSEACTVTWQGNGQRAKHVPAAVDAITRRLPSGRK